MNTVVGFLRGAGFALLAIAMAVLIILIGVALAWAIVPLGAYFANHQELAKVVATVVVLAGIATWFIFEPLPRILAFRESRLRLVKTVGLVGLIASVFATGILFGFSVPTDPTSLIVLGLLLAIHVVSEVKESVTVSRKFSFSASIASILMAMVLVSPLCAVLFVSLLGDLIGDPITLAVERKRQLKRASYTLSGFLSTAFSVALGVIAAAGLLQMLAGSVHPDLAEASSYGVILLAGIVLHAVNHAMGALLIGLRDQTGSGRQLIKQGLGAVFSTSAVLAVFAVPALLIYQTGNFFAFSLFAIGVPTVAFIYTLVTTTMQDRLHSEKS